LLWFFIGATATACWIKYKEVQRCHSAWSHHCIRSSIQLPALPSTPDTRFSWIQRDILKAINDIPPAGDWEGQLTQCNEEKEALFAFGRRVGDKLAVLSETVLDKVLCFVLILKANLARRRTERDQQTEERKGNSSF